MTWMLVLVLAAGAYGFKALGLIVIGDRALPPVVERCIVLIPAAMLAALVMQETFGFGQGLRIDARAVGVGAAVVVAWRRAPLILVIITGAAVTAAVRALG
jgi:branched-subunit amino acid transport protein